MANAIQTDKTNNEISGISNHPSARLSTCKCGKPFEQTGRVFFCEECTKVYREQQLEERRKLEQERINARIERLIPRLYQQAHLDHLSEQLVDRVTNLASGQGLYLWGEPGVGKTYAMAGLARHFIEQRLHVLRVVWEQLLYDIKATFKSEHTTESSILRPLVEADRLFIEDIGTTTSLGRQESDFAVRTLQSIIDSRIESCRPTYITSNKAPEALNQSFDARIQSRIAGHCFVIRLAGKDRRQQQ